MKPGEHILARTGLAIVLALVAGLLLRQLSAPSNVEAIGGGIIVGASAGASLGLILNRPWRFAIIGAAGCLLFVIFGLMN